MENTHSSNSAPEDKKALLRQKQAELRGIKRILGECYECFRPAVRGGRCPIHYLKHLERHRNAYNPKRRYSRAAKLGRTMRMLKQYTELLRKQDKVILECTCGARLEMATSRRSLFPDARRFIVEHFGCEHIQVHHVRKENS